MANSVKLGKIPTLKWLKIEDIKIPEFRLHSHLEDHRDFEESIKADGIIQPIYVFEDNGVYWLADGQNRLETAKKHDKLLIPAYVLDGSETDAILHSVKLNLLRGKINLGELAEFLSHVKTRFGWTVEKIAFEFNLSKAYVSQLLSIAETPAVLEKLKNGLLSVKEAYNEVLSLTVKPISEEKASFEERSQKQGVLVSQETRQPLSDTDLGLTQEFEEEKPRHKKEETKKEQSKRTEFMTCDYCGKILSRLDVKWIKVHADEYDKVLLAIHELAEREAQKESPQP